MYFLLIPDHSRVSMSQCRVLRVYFNIKIIGNLTLGKFPRLTEKKHLFSALSGLEILQPQLKNRFFFL